MDGHGCDGERRLVCPHRQHTIRLHALKAWIVGLCLCLVYGGASAQDPGLDVASMGHRPLALVPHFDVLEDASHSRTLAELLQPAMQAAFVRASETEHPLNYGFSRSAFWFRLTLQNSSGAPIDRFIDIHFPNLSNIDFYHPLADGRHRGVHTGAAHPFATRAYPNRFFVFPVTLPAHSSQSIYFRVQSQSGILIPATLWEPAAFLANERNEYIVQAAYLGLAAALVLYNLLLFATLRDPVYGLYSVFAILMALAISAANGFAMEFLWPNASWWSNMSLNVLYSLAMAAQILFIRRTLDLRVIAPRIDAFLKFLLGSLVLYPLAFLVSFERFAAPVSMAWALSGLALFVVLVHVALVHKNRLAALVALAFSMLLLGGLMVELKTLALLPHNAFTEQGLQIGSALEMLLLAFTLAYRFNLMRREATAIVETANADLEKHLQAQAAELTAAHYRLRESDRLQTLSQERQRFMQDMHDGVGSSLTTALRVVERGRLDGAAVAHVLRNCIDDLKLAIDSMEPVGEDLVLLLATLRSRIGRRLEDGGVLLQWQVADIVGLDWLDPKSSLHILRILQEAFANIVKHAQATDVILTARMVGNQIAISVRDNGRGLSSSDRTPGQLIGKGLGNQRRRAQEIGATVRLESSSAGTCVTLLLPTRRERA